MVFSAEERLERRRAASRKYDAKHKVEKAAYNAAYETKHKAEKAAYYAKHKAEKAAYYAVYNATPAHKKLNTISSWKRYGLVHDDFDSLYFSYLQTTQCDICKNEFKDSFDRCMDHDHDTGLFRQFLCRPCNIFDNWKTKV